MRLLVAFLVLFFLFTPTVISYPQEQLQDCIASAKQNPSIEGVTEESIESYCDCALTLIVDQGEDIRSSGYECALKNFE